jgi:murein DD-endopeptidase MepM/ murein hydrolase activator NlpD
MFFRALYYLFGGLVFAGVVLFVAYQFFNSPKELMLKRENEQYAIQLDLLNKRVDKLSKVLEDIENRDDNIYRTIFEAEPIPSEVRKAGIGGADRYEDLKGYQNSQMIIETAQKIDRLSRELYIQSTSFDEVYRLAKNKAKMLASIPAIQPISNKSLKRIASGFGYRIHPIYKTWRMHTGIDFTAPIGTPIYATGDGVVERKKGKMTGYGKVVVIDHGYGYESLYAHMSKIIVKPGEKVKRGQVIGYVGNTGRSTGPHLHYEIKKNGKPVNPVHFFFQDLTPEEYEKVIEIASRPNQSMS